MVRTRDEIMSDVLNRLEQLAGDWEYSGDITPETLLLADLLILATCHNPTPPSQKIKNMVIIILTIIYVFCLLKEDFSRENYFLFLRSVPPIRGSI